MNMPLIFYGLLIAGALGMQLNYPHRSKRTKIGFQNIYNKAWKIKGTVGWLTC